MVYILGFVILLALDILVKNWTVTTLMPIGTMPIIPKIFSLTYAENKGAAFSMLEGARWFFIVTAIVFLICICFAFKKNFFTTWWSKWGAVFLAAGTVGNAIDRAKLGYVIDMFELKFINFAIFNVADLFITVGAIIFGIFILFFEGKNV